MRGLLWVALLGLVAADAHAQSIDVDRIRIFEYGIYSGRTEASRPQEGTATGTINTVADLKLVAQTERIPARIGTRFGFGYEVVGRPRDASARMTFITRFPPQGVVNANGIMYFQNEFEASVPVGVAMTRTYTFDEPWELATGEWTLEIHYRGRKLAEKRFVVVEP
ncbi:MAG: DUF3859 domain-containing protein [Hyphomicrobiaceae bacterium]|nr:MAG: DUF3859 domain-containing protein [Hyphomicrobiaceae bacterium]